MNGAGLFAAEGHGAREGERSWLVANTSIALRGEKYTLRTDFRQRVWGFGACKGPKAGTVGLGNREKNKKESGEPCKLLIQSLLFTRKEVQTQNKFILFSANQYISSPKFIETMVSR